MAAENDKSRQILQAATEIFLGHGFSAATTDMIQKQAKVSKATLYQCFPNKEALFAAVIEDRCLQMEQALRSIDTHFQDIRGSLTDLGTTYLRFILSPQSLALFRISIAEAPRFPQLARQFYLSGPRGIVKIIAAELEKAAENRQVEMQQFGYETSASLFIGMLRCEIQTEYLTHPDAHASDVQVDYWVNAAVFTFMKAFAYQA